MGEAWIPGVNLMRLLKLNGSSWKNSLPNPLTDTTTDVPEGWAVAGTHLRLTRKIHRLTSAWRTHAGMGLRTLTRSSNAGASSVGHGNRTTTRKRETPVVEEVYLRVARREGSLLARRLPYVTDGYGGQR